jgi:AcrR family transcriptional regulator
MMTRTHAIIPQNPALTGEPQMRRRMKPADRERLIVLEATRYFAEAGWSAGTEELARRLGVTQPLLFRYFPTKELLIDRIYSDIEKDITNPAWLRLIEDPSCTLEDRLTDFYRDYVARVMTRDCFRLFLFAGLANVEHLSDRFYGRMRKTIFPAIARALRAEFQPKIPRRKRITALEMELVQSLHGMFHHVAIRRWVYGPKLEMEVADLIPMKVTLFVRGAAAVLGESE